MKELTIEASLENMETVTAFVDEQLESLGCPMKAQMQIDIAIDELFGNIVHYAYNPEVGPATVRVEVQQEPLAVVITFIDHGVPYDPLAKDDPDTTLSAEERQIGGLGIYMVKKSMDEIAYEYKNGQNILTIKKALK
jgi:anti-sigma regulatory factor (Ser/Thr protein kinase)